VDRALLLLQKAAAGGAAAFIRAAASPDPYVSLKGAEAIYNQLLRFTSFLELEERVAALEKERKPT
jgi:hypothetical protein